MITSNSVITNLDILFPNAACELNYKKDYELLIATILSAQATDKGVNKVTEILFDKYDLTSLSKSNLLDIEKIIKPIGTYKKKAKFLKEVAIKLINDYQGIVPNNRSYLESLPGVGRKTTNVVLANIYNIPAIAVDTHVNRVSKRLGIAEEQDDLMSVEKKLMKFFPKNKWNKIHHQLVLFGRYICQSKKPNCTECLFKNECKYLKIIQKSKQ